MTREAKIPGPDHPITVEPTSARVVVRIGGRILAGDGPTMNCRGVWHGCGTVQRLRLTSVRRAPAFLIIPSDHPVCRRPARQGAGQAVPAQDSNGQCDPMLSTSAYSSSNAPLYRLSALIGICRALVYTHSAMTPARYYPWSALATIASSDELIRAANSREESARWCSENWF